jgi:hypothetical protein
MATLHFGSVGCTSLERELRDKNFERGFLPIGDSPAQRAAAPEPPPIEPEPFQRLEMFDVVASIHESAHACWNYLRGEPVHSVEITKQGRGGGEFKATPDSGTVELSEDDDLETRVRQDGRILGAILDPATCAQWLRQLPGFVVSRHAQRRFGAKGEFYDRLCGHDGLVVERIINLMVADPAERRRLHDQVECEAREFVDRHWYEIEKLGNVLFERGRLDKHEIEAVLAAPKQSEPEFRRRQDGFIAPPCLDASLIGSYHEAGHAAVAVSLGQKVKRLSVNPDGTGLCRVAQLPTTQNRRALLHYCAVASAGGIAASRLTGENRWGAQDHQNIETKLGEVDIREAVAILHEARKLATQIIDARWSDVCTLARKLRQRGEMDGAEVTSLLSGLRAAA